MAQRTFGQKIAIGFAISALILIGVAIMGYVNADRLIDNEKWVSHTHQVRREIADLLSGMKDAETGERGFIITGSNNFLEPYEAAMPLIERTFDSLRKLTSDNPDQQRRLDAIRPVIDARLEDLKTRIELRRSDGLDAAAKAVSMGAGKKHMDQIRRLLSEMDRDEEQLLAKRAEIAEASAGLTRMVVFWGAVGGVIFVAVVGWLIISSLTKQVGSAVQHVQSSSSELQTAANQQASGSREQATSMSEISTTISELLATSRQIAESSQRVAQIASDTASAARNGEQTIDRSQESVTAVKKQVDLIVGHMLELGKKSQQIGSILEIINELSEQTNILAINATIEAAGAGESGKRFSVVADEIRKLADRVGGSTKEIRSLIDEIRAAVNTTVMVTETGSKAADGGARQFTEVATSFRQIAKLVQTTTEAAREIELSTKQQSTAVEQVNLAIANVAQATKENEVSSSQTLQTASQLASLSRELTLLVHSPGV